MSVMNQLPTLLKKLRLSGVLESLEARVSQASQEDLSYEEFLLRLICDEVERREQKQLALRLRRAQFDSDKSLEEFDFKFNANIPKGRLLELGCCKFVSRKENICLVGPAGVGKSHIAQALGQRACKSGYRVLFMSARQMLMEMRASRADGSWDKQLSRLLAPEVLIIDDLGLAPLRGDEPMDLYEVIRGRYEKGSLIVTSNRAMEEWYPLFGDALLASAAMDRLLHHAHVVVMQGDSFRNPPTRNTSGG